MTGVFLVVLQGCRRHKISFSKELLGAIIFAFVFSFICFIAADYNHTDDYSYVTYFISFYPVGRSLCCLFCYTYASW